MTGVAFTRFTGYGQRTAFNNTTFAHPPTSNFVSGGPRISQFSLHYFHYLTYFIYCRDVIVDIIKLDDDRWDRFQMLAGDRLSIVDPILQALPPFFHPSAAVPKGLWTSRSTPALWARCAASHFRPTNVLRVITPAETWFIGYPS